MSAICSPWEVDEAVQEPALAAAHPRRPRSRSASSAGSGCRGRRPRRARARATRVPSRRARAPSSAASACSAAARTTPATPPPAATASSTTSPWPRRACAPRTVRGARWSSTATSTRATAPRSCSALTRRLHAVAARRAQLPFPAHRIRPRRRIPTGAGDPDYLRAFNGRSTCAARARVPVRLLSCRCRPCEAIASATWRSRKPGAGARRAGARRLRGGASPSSSCWPAATPRCPRHGRHQRGGRRPSWPWWDGPPRVDRGTGSCAAGGGLETLLPEGG